MRDEDGDLCITPAAPPTIITSSAPSVLAPAGHSLDLSPPSSSRQAETHDATVPEKAEEDALKSIHVVHAGPVPSSLPDNEPEPDQLSSPPCPPPPVICDSTAIAEE